MKKLFYVCLASSSLLACSESSEKRSGSVVATQPSTVLSDLKMETSEEGEGELPQPGDVIHVHYYGTLLSNGDTFDNSYSYGRPYKFTLGKGQVIRGWEEGMAKLRKGARARLTVPAHLAYAEREVPGVPKHSDLVFDVHIVDIEPSLRLWDVSGLEFKETMSGLRYAIITEGKGKRPNAGQTVRVHYSGYLAADKKMFDSSIERNEPLEFALGTGQVIPGWEEGIALLKIGTKAQLHIPAHLGYGERGAGEAIPPNADLIFDVELVGVK